MNLDVKCYIKYVKANDTNPKGLGFKMINLLNSNLPLKTKGLSINVRPFNNLFVWFPPLPSAVSSLVSFSGLITSAPFALETSFR